MAKTHPCRLKESKLKFPFVRNFSFERNQGFMFPFEQNG